MVYSDCLHNAKTRSAVFHVGKYANSALANVSNAAIVEIPSSLKVVLIYKFAGQAETNNTMRYGENCHTNPITGKLMPSQMMRGVVRFVVMKDTDTCKDTRGISVGKKHYSCDHVAQFNWCLNGVKETMALSEKYCCDTCRNVKGQGAGFGRRNLAAAAKEGALCKGGCKGAMHKWQSSCAQEAESAQLHSLLKVAMGQCQPPPPTKVEDAEKTAKEQEEEEEGGGMMLLVLVVVAAAGALAWQQKKPGGSDTKSLGVHMEVSVELNEMHGDEDGMLDGGGFGR